MSVATDHGPGTTDNARHLATMLSVRCLAAPFRRADKELFEIPIAVVGTWVKGGSEFSITLRDLQDIVHNFEKRKNDQVVIDYEHASEMPEMARGGPIPAAGWIHELKIDPLSGRTIEPLKSANDSMTQSLNGSVLKALVEWTPDAAEMIRKGQYRFFSPAIDWSALDKETGEAQGATLTSGALTNHPFLEELPPIMLTDLAVVSGQSSVVCGKEERPRDNGQRTMVDISQAHQDGFMQNVSVAYRQGGIAVKKLTVKKLKDSKGKRRVFDDVGVELGDINLDELDLDDAELDELMAGRGRPGGRMDDTLGELLGEVGMLESSTEEIRRLLRPARQLGVERVERAARGALLSETLKDGAINLDIAAKLADQGRISFGDYRAIQKAHHLVEQAVADGKFLPADREFISRLALSEPERFEAWTRKKPRAVTLGGPTGVGGSTTENPARELSLRLSDLMREKNLDRFKALQELAQSDAELIRRWRWGVDREAGA